MSRGKIKKIFPSAEGGRLAAVRAAVPFFYRLLTVNLPLIQRLAAEGEFTLKVSVDIGRLRRPGDAGGSRQRQKGQGHQGFPAPLDFPDLPLDATPFGRASKCEGPTGAFGAPRYTP